MQFILPLTFNPSYLSCFHLLFSPVVLLAVPSTTHNYIIPLLIYTGSTYQLIELVVVDRLIEFLAVVGAIMLVKTTVPARISLLKAVVESTGAFRRLLHTRGGYIYKIINSFHIYFYKVCNLFNNQLKFIFKIFRSYVH